MGCKNCGGQLDSHYGYGKFCTPISDSSSNRRYEETVEPDSRMEVTCKNCGNRRMEHYEGTNGEIYCSSNCGDRFSPLVADNVPDSRPALRAVANAQEPVTISDLLNAPKFVEACDRLERADRDQYERLKRSPLCLDPDPVLDRINERADEIKLQREVKKLPIADDTVRNQIETERGRAQLLGPRCANCGSGGTLYRGIDRKVYLCETCRDNQTVSKTHHDHCCKAYRDSGYVIGYQNGRKSMSKWIAVAFVAGMLIGMIVTWN